MKHVLRIFIRNQKNCLGITVVSLFGLLVGIVISLLAFLWVKDELSFDRFHSNSGSIFRVLSVEQNGGQEVKYPYTLIPVAKTLMHDYPEVDKATFLKFESRTPLEADNQAVDVLPVYTNEFFFDLFDGYHFVEGNSKDAFATEGSVVLNETVAKKLFGNEPAIGKTVTVTNEDQSYIVEGVVRIPEQTHLNFGMITLMRFHPFLEDNFRDNWDRSEISTVYAKLSPKANCKIFEEKISKHLAHYKTTETRLRLQSLTDIHLHTDYKSALYDRNIGNIKYVWIFSGLAIFILVMSVLNFLVLFVVSSATRVKEVGIKKVNGASRIYLALQFIFESVFQVVIVLIVALFVVQVLLPFFNNCTGKSIVFHFSIEGLFFIFLSIILSGVIAGLYPAIFQTSSNVIHAFKSKTVINSKNKFIRTLVVIQFAIAIIFLTSSFIFIQQQDYIKNKDLGLDQQNVLVIDAGYVWDMKSIKNELLKNPNVLAVTASVSAPIDFVSKGKITVPESLDSIKASFLWVDESFAKTYHLNLLDGDFLQADDSSPSWEYQKEIEARNRGEKYLESIPVVINQAACKLLGLQNPIGQRLNNYVVKGVVADFNYESLYQAIGPLIMMKEPRISNTLSVRFAPENSSQTVQWICDTYQSMRKTSFVSYRFFDDMITEKYKNEVILKNLSILLSALAVFISSLGILALSFFLTDKRTKEIGIRKVNGAKISEVMTMLNRDFVKWVAIAFVIATPISWYVMNKWLENFAYKTNLSWWIFALAGLLALGIALLTVSWQSWKAATRNPVEALRYE